MKQICSRGKHSRQNKRRKLNKRKVVLVIFLFIVFAFLVIKILQNHENKMNDDFTNLSDIENTNINEQNDKTNERKLPTILNIDMPDKMDNYNVIGQLVIEKIDLEKYILNKTTKNSLNVSVTKLYGPDVNGKGNLCIIGHNSKGLFIKLKKLEINDTFYIIDKKNCEKVTYQIYDKYTVIPTDLDCLNQKTNDERKVTLITCNPRRVDEAYTQSKRGIE